MKKSATILTADVERWMQIAQDIKKEFVYNRATGAWAWVDRDEKDNLDAYHFGFPTFLAALEDAVEPYLEEEES